MVMAGEEYGDCVMNMVMGRNCGNVWTYGRCCLQMFLILPLSADNIRRQRRTLRSYSSKIPSVTFHHIYGLNIKIKSTSKYIIQSQGLTAKIDLEWHEALSRSIGGLIQKGCFGFVYQYTPKLTWVRLT